MLTTSGLIENSSLLLQALTLLLGFYMAWNIGANDVANAMGTSVGSKSLTLKQAVLLAAVLEFAGAFFVGSNVSQTIQKGIIDPQVFQAAPIFFVFGMLGALLATGILLQAASYFKLPISTTHAIVGAVLGFGALIGGIDAIHWSKVGWIAASWLFSPLLSGLLSYFLFRLLQKKIFQAPNPILAAEKLVPLLVFCSFQVILLNICDHSSFQLSIAASLSISAALSLCAAFVSRMLVQKAPLTVHGVSLAESPLSVEKIFVSLQILSACLVAFAHGANDVANAIGPVAAVFGVLQTHTIALQTTVPSWLLALGGAGIVIGLATWGWRVIETIGSKITELTPSRGFAAELGAAVTILLASKLGLPISTTHALVGSVFGVGIARGIKALNLQTLKEIVISWIVTIPLSALLSILMFYLLKSLFL